MVRFPSIPVAYRYFLHTLSNARGMGDFICDFYGRRCSSLRARTRFYGTEGGKPINKVTHQGSPLRLPVFY